MNARFCIRLAVAGLVCALAHAGFAQDIKGIPDSIKMSEPAQVGPVKTFIAAQFARIKSDNPAEQSAARDALIGELSARVGKESNSYLAAYSVEVNARVLGLVSEPSPTARLNAAIVLARTAERSKSPALVEATIACLQDRLGGVALWGAKAAGSILVNFASAGRVVNSPLLPALIKSVKSHPNSGAVADEVFSALTLDYTNVRPTEGAVQWVVPGLLDLLDFRISLYSATNTPDEPFAERPATGFLTNDRVTPFLSPAQQTQAVQLLQNLLAVSTQRAAMKRDDADQLWRVIVASAQALGFLDQATLANVCKPYINARGSSNFQALVSSLPAVHNAIIGIERFSSVKDFPILKAPASTPTAPVQ